MKNVDNKVLGLWKEEDKDINGTFIAPKCYMMKGLKDKTLKAKGVRKNLLTV